MFGDVLMHLGCILNRRFPCEMSYECVQVDSEHVLCQDPINGLDDALIPLHCVS
jgi:hypothetical protein